MSGDKATSVSARSRNDRETGARKFPAVPSATDRDKEGLEAAENRSSGLAEPLSDTPEKVRKSDGRNPASRQNPNSAAAGGADNGELKK